VRNTSREKVKLSNAHMYHALKLEILIKFVDRHEDQISQHKIIQIMIFLELYITQNRQCVIPVPSRIGLIILTSLEF
jgi:hypothetical protein